MDIITTMTFTQAVKYLKPCHLSGSIITSFILKILKVVLKSMFNIILVDTCLNYGICVPVGDFSSDLIRCSCQPGYTGVQCQTNIDDCQQHQCGAHGKYWSVFGIRIRRQARLLEATSSLIIDYRHQISCLHTLTKT